MSARDWVDEFLNSIRNTDPAVWVTAKDKHILVDDMTESHVRNTLKCILRHAHDGKVWAISPDTGGLRHYNKGDPNVAIVTVKKEEPKVVNKWDGIESINLALTKREAQGLLAVAGKGFGGGPLHDIYMSLEHLAVDNPARADLSSGFVKFTGI